MHLLTIAAVGAGGRSASLTATALHRRLALIGACCAGMLGGTAPASLGAGSADASTVTMRVVRTMEISCSMSRFAAIAKATTAANATARCARMPHRRFSENARNRRGLIRHSQGPLMHCSLLRAIGKN